MKNKLFKAATLCCVTILFAACNKDEASGPGQSENPTQSKDPIEQLRSFRHKLNEVKAHPEAKNGETIPLSEALWGVENNFNLTYADAEQYYSRINEHEFMLDLPVNQDQQVSLNDVADLYSNVIIQARDAFASDEFDDKGFISLTIKETLEENGNMHITFSGKTGERTNYDPPVFHQSGPFGVDDNWMFASPMGKCDDPDIPSGADEQLQEKLYSELIEPYTEASPGYRNIYVDRVCIIFDGTNNPGIYYTNELDKLCIEHEYMNDYYHGEKNMITRTIPNNYHLEGYSPISISILGISINEYSAVTHYNEIEYGIRTQVRIDEFGELEDLLQ